METKIQGVVQKDAADKSGEVEYADVLVCSVSPDLVFLSGGYVDLVVGDKRVRVAARELVAAVCATAAVSQPQPPTIGLVPQPAPPRFPWPTHDQHWTIW